MARVPDERRQRILLALSRYPQTPGTLVVELDADGWHVVSEDEHRSDARAIAARNRADADRRAILAALDAESPLTRKDPEDATGAPSRQWYPTLEALLKDGSLRRTGAGKKGDPHRFEIVRADESSAYEDSEAARCAETDEEDGGSGRAATGHRPPAQTKLGRATDGSPTSRQPNSAKPSPAPRS
jgi:hypothetical protein